MRTRFRPLLTKATLLLALLGLATLGVLQATESPELPGTLAAIQPVGVSLQPERARRQPVLAAWTAPERSAEEQADPEPQASVVAQPLEVLPSRRLYGFVLDELGQPVAGARLTPWRQVGAAETLELARSVLSERSGAFELDGEPRGTTRVRVEHESFQTTTEPLGSLGEHTIRLLSRAHLVGRVVTATGAPAADHRVELRSKKGPASAPFTVTDGSGRFEFRPAQPGPFSLDIRGPSGDLLDADVDPLAEGEQVFVIGATREVRARVLDAVGEPLPGARVVLMRAGVRRALDTRASDGAGLVLFEHAPDEPLELLAEHPHLRFVPVVAEPTEPTELRGAPGATLRLVTATDAVLELRLHPGPGVADVTRTQIKWTAADLVCSKLAPGAWQLEVSQLSSSEGPPVRGALLESRELVLHAGQEQRLELEALLTGALHGSVSARPDFAVQVLLEADKDRRITERCTLDAEGTFGFEKLAAGRYRLLFAAAGGGVFRDPRCFDVRPGDPVQVTASLPAFGVDLLIQDVGGRPIPNAEVVVSGALRSTGSLLHTDALGNQRSTATHPKARAAADGSVFLAWAAPATGGHPITSVTVTAPGFEPLCLDVHSTYLEVLLHHTQP